MIGSVFLVGTGNVAWHLGKRLVSQGISLAGVLGRNPQQVEETLLYIGIKNGFLSVKDIPKDADLYLLAVSDDSIELLARQLSTTLPNDRMIAHTSGSTASNVFDPFFQNFGVLYPLQTFSKSRSVDFSRVPICVYASNARCQVAFIELATKLSPVVHLMDDPQRGALHLAAVFANNFTNHLYTIAAEICRQQNVPFDLLRPLILETAHKVMVAHPAEMQTGPAKRHDHKTMQLHKKALENQPLWQRLYELMSTSIESMIANKP